MNAEEAILTHIEGLLMDEEIVPPPSSIEELKKTFNNPSYIWILCDIDMNKLSENIKRINITIPEKLLSKIDSYASTKGETRSGFLAHAAVEYMSRHCR